MPRGDTSSDLKDLAKASTTRDDDSSLNKKPECASAHEGPRHETTVESVHVESSPYLGSQIQTDSIQSNVLSEVRPFAAAARRRDRETDHFQQRHAYNSRSDFFDSPIDQVSGPLAANPGARPTHPVAEAADGPLPCSSTLSSATPASALEGTVEQRSTEPSNPARKAEWTSFPKRPSEGKLSAWATLRYIHVGKPVAPKPVEQLREPFPQCKDRATRP